MTIDRDAFNAMTTTEKRHVGELLEILDWNLPRAAAAWTSYVSERDAPEAGEPQNVEDER